MKVRIRIWEDDQLDVDMYREYDLTPPKAAFGIHPADAPTPGFTNDTDAINHIVNLAIATWKELT